jgi:HK97 family phage major capsid protein/HK97 family phage prohead protease
MDKIKIGKLNRSFERAAIKIDEETRTVEFSFSSEAPVERWFGKEILSHETGAADLSRLNDGANLLFNHDWDVPVGVIEKAWIAPDKRGYVQVRFSKNAKASEIFSDVKDGVLRNVSFGYQINDLKREVEGDGTETYIAQKWLPFEVSIVTVPADQTVGIGRSAKDDEYTREFVFEDKTKKIVATPVAEGAVMTPEEIKAAEAKARAEAQAEERTRIAGISALGEKFDQRDLAKQMIESGKSLEEARAIVLDKISVRQAPVTGKEGDLGLTDKETRQFSFVKIANALANPTDKRAQEAAAFEREVSEAAQKKLGKQARGFYVPQEILTRDLVKGTNTAGGFSVATNLVSFIELFRNKSVVQRAGATVMNGLVGDIAIPKQNGGATAYWVAESGAVTESQQTFGQVTMAPKTLGAFTDISRKLLIQSSLDIENLVRSDLAAVCALAMDLAALYGSGASNQPLGLKGASINTVDFAANVPTFAEIVQLETEIAADNADIGTMKYVMNAAGRGALKSAEKAANTGMYIWEPGNTVNGYGVEVSNQVAANDFWFGNWSELMIGMWSGLDVTVDPYTQATSGTVRIVTLQDVDVAVRHPESFCRGNNSLA